MSEASSAVTERPELPYLHDAVLLAIHVGWTDETADVDIEIDLIDIEPACHLVASEVVELKLSHSNPWGPSEYINEAKLDEHVNGEFTLTLLMQSGDEILVRGRTLSVRS